MKVVCLGDSLTVGYGVRPACCWVRLAAAETGFQLVNEGVSGDTAGGMLARLQARLLPAWSAGRVSRPEAVLVMGGSNDIFYSGTDRGARADMGAMLQAIAAAGILPLAGLPLPVATAHIPAGWRELTDYDRAAELLAEYSDWLRRFCRVFSLPLVDFRADFLTETGEARPALLPDGVHPTREGHVLMARRLCPVLRRERERGGWE